jgi:hypothetical protein
MIMNKDLIANAVTAAFAAAETAGREQYARVGERDCCGFGWVLIRPARGPLVSYLKKMGIGGSEYGGGYSIWMPGRQPTQSMSVHEAAAKAFAATIKNMLGSDLNITWRSRMD